MRAFVVLFATLLAPTLGFAADAVKDQQQAAPEAATTGAIKPLVIAPKHMVVAGRIFFNVQCTNENVPFVIRREVVPCNEGARKTTHGIFRNRVNAGDFYRCDVTITTEVAAFFVVCFE